MNVVSMGQREIMTGRRLIRRLPDHVVLDHAVDRTALHLARQQDVVVVRVIRSAVIVVNTVRVVVVRVVMKTGHPQSSALGRRWTGVRWRQTRSRPGESLLDNLLARCKGVKNVRWAHLKELFTLYSPS